MIARAAERLVSASPPRGSWTGPHICHLFVRARCAFNGRAFLVSGGIPGAVESVVLKPVESSQMPPGPLKVLHWFNRYLDDSEKAQMREWLRVKVGAGGRSLRDVVEDHPSWGTWSTFNRRRDRICWRVAWKVDARGVPWFDLDADGHVIGL